MCSQLARAARWAAPAAPALACETRRTDGAVVSGAANSAQIQSNLSFGLPPFLREQQPSPGCFCANDRPAAERKVRGLGKRMSVCELAKNCDLAASARTAPDQNLYEIPISLLSPLS